MFMCHPACNNKASCDDFKLSSRRIFSFRPVLVDEHCTKVDPETKL